MISPLQRESENLVGVAAKSAKTLARWQQEKAWEALVFAKENSPWYAERFVGVDPARGWGEVPTMSAKDLRDPFALLCAPARDVARVVTLQTTGTQKQKRLLFSADDLKATTDFFACGMSTMVRRGQHVAVLMRGHEPHTIGDLLKKGLMQNGVTASVHFPFGDDVADEIENADCIVGLPVPTLRVARKHPHLRPETVLLSADYVPQSVVEGIEGLWGCRVLTHYGMTETGYGLGVQCLCRQGYHLRDAEYLCEILDPATQSPLPPGGVGEVVLTTLSRRAMPLIRYRTGDVAHSIDGPCACGSPLHTLGKVRGRIGFDAGLSITLLDEAVFSIQTVYDMRAAMHGDRISLMVECAPGTREQTRRAINAALGEGVDITFTKLPMFLKKRCVQAYARPSL
jgi:phenylacetate-CoA ligase